MSATRTRFFSLSPKRNSPFLTKAALLALIGCGMASGNLANAQTTNSSTLYLLNSGSSFQEGCFPPCECPITVPLPVTGTFLLTPTGFDGLFNNYAVSNVNWDVSIAGTDTVVTGSGTYKIGGEVALEQELSLDLQMNGAAAEHFDSGLVVGPAPFPDIKVSISLHGQVCFDKVFNVSASPAAPEPVPGISGLSLAGTNLVITGTNGMAGHAYTVLTSSNLALSFNQWTPVATMVLSNSGNFTITATNAVDLAANQKFFIFRMQ